MNNKKMMGIIRLDKYIKAVLTVIAVCICSFIHAVNAEEVYSKADAIQMFSMSLDDWNANVISVHASGAGVGMGQPETGYGLAMQTAVGQVMVTPHYTRSDKPDFLQVAIAYPPAIARMLTLEALEESGKMHVEQMLPEFTLTHEVEKFEGGFLTIAFIREN